MPIAVDTDNTLNNRFSVILLKSQLHFFVEIEKSPKILWNLKDPQTIKILRKNKARGLIFLDFKTYFKATIIKMVHKDKHIDQWNRAENRNKCSDVWSNKSEQGNPDYTIRKQQFLQSGNVGKTISKHRRAKTNHNLVPCTKNNSK